MRESPLSGTLGHLHAAGIHPGWFDFGVFPAVEPGQLHEMPQRTADLRRPAGVEMTEFQTMTRPTCRRCNGPLDLWWGEEKSPRWICNNPEPIDSDEKFFVKWGTLPGDDVVRLSRKLE